MALSTNSLSDPFAYIDLSKPPEIICARALSIINDSDPLSMLSRCFQRILNIDRFGFFTKYSKYNVLNPNIDIRVFKERMESYEMSDIINKRAMYFKTQAETNNIHFIIPWSGGVDSTVVLSAFIQNKVPTQSYIVIHNQNAINEYPEFVQKLRYYGVNTIVNGDISGELSKHKDSVFVPGCCGDQMFQYTSPYLKLPELMGMDWKDSILRYWSNMKFMFDDGAFRDVYLSNNDIESLFDIYQQYFDFLGFNVKTYGDLSFVYNFGIHYTKARNHMLLWLKTSKDYPKIDPFFDTLDFQKWAVYNFENLSDYNCNNAADAYKYRRPLKEYIYNFNHDKFYLDHKWKEQSMRNDVEFPTPVYVIDTHGIHIYTPRTKAIGQRYDRKRLRVMIDIKNKYMRSSDLKRNSYGC